MDARGMALVTGAAGFIGYHLSRRLLDAGWRVAGLDNLNGYYDVSLKQARLDELRARPGFSFLQGDLADQGAVEGAFARFRPNVVVNLAAQAGVRYSIENPRAYADSNLVGMLNVLEGCRRHPVQHLLYASSSSVYGNRQTAPFSVDDPADHPVSLYAATKKADELMANAYSHLYRIPATGLRFFTVYGPFGRPDMAYFSFTRKILAGQPIQVFGGGDMYRDFTYVDDVTDAVERMLDHPPSDNPWGDPHVIYNVGNHSPERLTDFIAALEQCLGVTAQKEYLPMQPGDVYKTCADVGPLMRDFGFAPNTPLREGLKRFVAWYRDYYAI